MVEVLKEGLKVSWGRSSKGGIYERELLMMREWEKLSVERFESGVSKEVSLVGVVKLF